MITKLRYFRRDLSPLTRAKREAGEKGAPLEWYQQLSWKTLAVSRKFILDVTSEFAFRKLMIRKSFFFSFSSDSFNYRVIFYCYWFESFNGESSEIAAERFAHERINRTLWTRCTFKQLSRAFCADFSMAFRVAIYSCAVNKTRWRSTRCAGARQISHDGDEKWRQLILWFPD